METVLIISVTAAATVVVIVCVICLGCIYCMYLRWVKHPLIHPAPGTTLVAKNQTEVQDMHSGEKESEMKRQNSAMCAEKIETIPQTYLSLTNGRIIKPQMCLSQDMLSSYRMIYKKHLHEMINPPGKVPQLYEHVSMVKFQKEHKIAFGSLDSIREPSSNMGTIKNTFDCSFSITKQCRLDLISDVGQSINEETETNEEVNDHNQQNSVENISIVTENDSIITENDSMNLDKSSDTCTVNTVSTGVVRSISNISCYSDEVGDRFVRPTDVDLGGI